MKPGDPAAVEQLFDAVAPRYDRLNDVLSFGLHRQWKRQLVRALKPVAGEHWLDLCCGTGDLALELGRCVRPAGAVTGLDAAAAREYAIAREGHSHEVEGCGHADGNTRGADEHRNRCADARVD